MHCIAVPLAKEHEPHHESQEEECAVCEGGQIKRHRSPPGCAERCLPERRNSRRLWESRVGDGWFKQVDSVNATPPRTRHRDGNTPRFTNRLVRETSPYLRQHAHNPVDWFPWGDEAFDLARREGKPVFLSIGYSTCHWCHVMEEESFEDPEVAETLNDRYVAIKVDREERPDVDAVYMTAVQTLTRHGGWPMSVWLDAQRQPFFAGTYFPARDGERGAGKGFLTLLRELDEIYRAEPRRVAEAASSIVSAVRAAMASAPAGSVLPTLQTLDAAYAF